jgi:hypothetical protein
MASPHSFRISPVNPSGPTDLFLQILLKFSNNFSVSNKSFTRVG